MNPTDYVAASAFSDEHGQAILTRLWELYGNLEINPETNKKVRQGSSEKRYAVAALQAELIKAGAHFEHAREFDDWLYNNMAGVVDAYNPILAEIEITNKLHNFEWQLERIDERYQGRVKTLCLLVQDIIKRLPQEAARETDQLMLDILAREVAS